MKNMPVQIPAPFASVGDVVEGLARLERQFHAHGDRRGIFVTAYLTITRTLEDWLGRRRFLQNDLVAGYVVVFANAYRQALESHHDRRPDIPTAWRLSFDASADVQVSVLQHLLLGINAHINHDLPYAVLEGGLDVRCKRCYRDHQRINGALRAATPLVRQRITALYHRPFHLATWVYGRMIDEAVSVAFVGARQHSWVLARALEDAGRPAERQRVGDLIDRRAAAVGHAILRRHAAWPWPGRP